MTAHFPPLGKTVSELAVLVGGRAEGDLDAVIDGAAGLAEAGPRDVSFLENPKYASAVALSKAGCVLLPASGGDLGCAAPSRIYAEDPRGAFARVLELIEAGLPKPPAVIDAKASVHYQAKLGPNVAVGPFAVIERGAAIGEGSTIGAQCYVGENAKVGRGCRLHPQVVVREDCVLGDGVIVHSGTVVGADGFGYTTDKKTGVHRKVPQLGNVVVESGVELGANVTIDRATTGSTVIGAGTKIDNLVQIAHNVKVGKGCFIVSQVGIAGSSEVGDFVILAGQAGVAGHVKIGSGAVIAAQTGVMADVEPKKTMFGSPARPHREAFKLQALYGRLPEVFEALKELKKEA